MTLLACLAAIVPAAAASSVQEWAIDAGTTGLLVEDHRVPLVRVTIEFPVGTWSPWCVANDADAAFEIQDHDPQGELRRRADRLAASLDVSSGNRSSWLSLSCRKEDLPAALDLARVVLANGEFDRAELKRRRQGAKLGWSAALKDPQFVLRQAAARLLFAESDPRRKPYEEPKLPGTNPAKLAAARDILIRIPGRVVGFAGVLTLDEARDLAAGLLPEPVDRASEGIEPILRPMTPTNQRPRELSVELPRLTQVYFAYGRDSLSYRDADYPASIIVDHALP